MTNRLLLVVFLACGLGLLAGCKKSPGATVAATVNGRPITYADLDKQYYAAQLSQSEVNEAEDLLTIQKLQVLRTLVDNELMLQRAEKLGLMAQDADVEAKFSELKAPYTQEEFQKQLADRKMTAEELKAQLRRDLSVQRLFNKEITSHISITDKDIADFYNSNKASFNLAEPRIRIAQLLVTPRPDPNVRNLKSDKAQTEEQAKKKIEMLAALIKQGEDFALLAQNYSEDAETSPNGGDLGYIAESALEKANVELRKTVMDLQPGQVSRILRTEEGYRILKVISKEPAGQRELNDPRVQQEIRATLLNGKDRLYKEVYYEKVRNESKIVNYFAESILNKMQGSK
jgi:peptidyl-prolyl cis-trans isomerase SurA